MSQPTQTKTPDGAGEGATTTTGQTDTTNKSPPPKYTSEPDTAILDRLNNETRIGLLFQMSLFVLLYLALSDFFDYLRLVRLRAIFFDEVYDDIDSDDSQDNQNELMAIDVCNMLGYLFLFIGTFCNMYYFDNFSSKNEDSKDSNNANGGNSSGARGGGNLRFIAPFLSMTSRGIIIFRHFISILYILSIIFIYTAHLIYLYNAYDDEDFATYPDTAFKDSELNGLKAFDWGSFWARPLLILLILLQHNFPNKFLYIFEWRIFLYSFILTSTMTIYTLFYVFYAWYKIQIFDTYEDEEKAAFSAASFFSVIILLSSGCLLVFSALKLNEMGQFNTNGVATAAPSSQGAQGTQGTQGAQSVASQKDVYRYYCILALIIFVAMFVCSICIAVSGMNRLFFFFTNGWVPGVLLSWICVLMIFIDTAW